MGWRGSADGAAVARALRHGIQHALSETVPEQPCTGEGKETCPETRHEMVNS